jgi:hypothetical protein
MVVDISHKLLFLLVLALVCVHGDLSAQMYQGIPANIEQYIDTQEDKEEKITPGYPSINGFFGKSSSGDSFFNTNNTSSSKMFETTSAVPSIEGISNTVELPREAHENKQYEMEVRNDPGEGEVQHEENRNQEEEIPESVRELDSSIETAVEESSSDPRIQSALKASQNIREAIFGKHKTNEAGKSTADYQKTKRKEKEESVRF